MRPKPRTPEPIRLAGPRALRRELEPVGMVRFLHQFDTGAGDYTRERREWRDCWTLEAIVAELEQQRERRVAS